MKAQLHTVQDLETPDDHRDVDALIRMLNDDTSPRRSQAHRCLVDIGTDAIPFLVENLRNESVAARVHTVRVLGDIGGPDVAPPLVAALEDTAFTVRYVAATCLVQIGPHAFPELLQALITRPESIWLRHGAEMILSDAVNNRDLPSFDFLLETIRFSTSHDALAAAARQAMAEWEATPAESERADPIPLTNTDNDDATRDTPTLLTSMKNLLAVLTCNCSRFRHAWKLMADKSQTTDDLEGLWQGQWLSDVSGHTGSLEAVIERVGENWYRATFHAMYWKVLRACYSVNLFAQRSDGQWIIQGDVDLGSLAGGVYRYRGRMSQGDFSCRYECPYDYGSFQLTRCPASPLPQPNQNTRLSS